MKQLSFIALLSGLLASSCALPSEKTKPHVILINIDDMGWRDVGFMGSEFYETPHIDGLSRQGMVFTDGYSTASNCAPSRACLMTGQWTPRHGIYTVNSSERGASKDRKLIPTENTVTLAEEFLTIPEVLQANGYATVHAGKWHLSDDPTKHGFDVNIGGGHNGHPKSYYPPYQNVELEAPNGEYLTDRIMDKTIEFIRSAEEPFFLNYAPYAVHTPIQPVDSLLDKYRDKPPWNGQHNIEYATMVDNLDRNIGRLISALKEKGVFENTFIVFTSDNGGLYGITKQLPLRAGKGSYYEGGIRVPFFFVWKGEVQPSTTDDSPVTNLDIFPTLLAVAGISPLSGMVLDGQNLLPVLQGTGPLESRLLYWHFPIYLQAYNVHDNQNRDSLFRTRPGSVVRYGAWKLHQYFEDDAIELYNLTDDVGEKKNLAAERPQKVEELLRLLEDWRQKTKAPVPKELNPEYLSSGDE